MFVISLITNEVGNEESYGIIDLGCSDAVCCCGVSPAAAAGENSPDRNSDRGLRVLLFRPGSKHFANGCASLAMSKEKTLSLSTDMQKGNSNGCLTLQPNWSVSKLTSSSPPARLF